MQYRLRTMLLAVLLWQVLHMNGQGMESIKFGSGYDEALPHIERLFGKPTEVNAHQCIYRNAPLCVDSVNFDEARFGFKDNRLVEARLYKMARSKAEAKRVLLSLKKELEKQHTLSVDYEEDGSAFYLGGVSPTGVGRLFVISITPRHGKWAAQLRYGPFRFANQ